MGCLLYEMATGWVGMLHWPDALQLLQGHWPTHIPLDLLAALDNKIEVDLMGDVQRAFNTFVRTGQVWAFLIGIVFGYLVKTFTTYG
jgi:hypothetical protein